MNHDMFMQHPHDNGTLLPCQKRHAACSKFGVPKDIFIPYLEMNEKNLPEKYSSKHGRKEASQHIQKCLSIFNIQQLLLPT